MSNQRMVVRLTGNFLITIMDDRRQWKAILDVLKGNYRPNWYPERDIYFLKMRRNRFETSRRSDRLLPQDLYYRNFCEYTSTRRKK